jgi:hypothetical protein
MRVEILQSKDSNYLPFVRAIMVSKNDVSKPCENCGRPSWQHELLFKEDQDWCMTCNDEHHGRDKWSDKKMKQWCMELMAKGMAIAVMYEDREE